MDTETRAITRRLIDPAEIAYTMRCYRAAIIVITVLGIAARLLYVLVVPTTQLYDFATFLQIASGIYNGYGHSLDGQPIAWVGPFYSFVLAGFYFIAGESILGMKLLNVLFSAATLVCSLFVFKKLLGRGQLTKPVIAAYAITAFFPQLIAYNNVAATESLFLLLLTLLLLVFLYVKRWWKQAALLGFLCALAALTKPFMLVYPAVMLVLWWWQEKRSGAITTVSAFFVLPALRRTAVRTALMALVMMAVISPWTVRNYNEFGRVILISYNRGYNQLINNNYANTHGGWMPLEAVPMSEELQSRVAESLTGRGIQHAHELEDAFSDVAWHWMLRNPAAVAQLALLRVERTFFSGGGDILYWTANGLNPDNAANSPFVFRRTFNAAQGLINISTQFFAFAGLLFCLLFFVPGIKSFFGKRATIPFAEGLVFINIAFFVTVVAMFEGQERYAHPVFVFFIFAVVWMWERLRPTAKAHHP